MIKLSGSEDITMSLKFEGSRVVWSLSGNTPRALMFAFLPGVMMVLLGAMLALTPKFLVYVIAASFLMFGGLLILAAWKVLLIRDQVNSILKNVRSEIQVQRFDMPIQTRADIFESAEPGKKTILH